MKVCSVTTCMERVKRGRFFCDECWKLVPLIIKTRLANAYTPGQIEGEPVTPPWIMAMRDAIKAVGPLKKPWRR